MLYRAYTPADREVCLAIFDSNLERYFSAGNRADLEKFLDAPPGYFGVLCDETGAVVGCGGIGVRDEGRTAVLTWGMICADRHRSGLGKELTLARLEKLVDFPLVEKVVMNTSQESLGFYVKMGFRLVKQTPNGYRAGLDRCDLEMPVTKASRAP